MRKVHDLGGMPGGPIDREEHELALWERRVHVLLHLLAERGVMTVDELRHGIESLGEAEYARLSYYQRWMHSITEAMLRRGVFTTDELGRKLAELEARDAREAAA